jgi:hypothetical protein
MFVGLSAIVCARSTGVMAKIIVEANTEETSIAIRRPKRFGAGEGVEFEFCFLIRMWGELGGLSRSQIAYKFLGANGTGHFSNKSG